MKLTDLKIKNAKPRERAYKEGDGKGLYLFVMPTGGKSWRYDYKLKIDIDKYKNGTFVYGPYPEISLAEVRTLHANTRKLLVQGIDPNEHKKEQERLSFQNKPLSFEEIAHEWLSKRQSEVKTKTLEDIKKRLNVDVIPEIGRIRIDKLHVLDILNMLKKIEKRGAYEMVNRARQYCGQILRYAVILGKAERDLTKDIGDALSKRPRTHQPALSPNEIHEFLLTLERNEARLFPQTRLALKMLMLTFVRPIELASAEWQEINFKDNLWIIPANKMKMKFDHVVPLSAQTVSILQELRVLNSHRRYIFPKQSNSKEHMSRDTLSKAVRSLGFQGRHSAHGFRALARTTIREKLNWDSEVIERQLAHAPNTSLGRAYDRTQFLEQRAKMMQDWGNYLDKIGQGKTVIVGNFQQTA